MTELGADEASLYPQVYAELDDGTGHGVSGESVLRFSRGTHLPRKVLRSIWGVADASATGFLSPSEFYVFLRCVGLAQAGRDFASAPVVGGPGDFPLASLLDPPYSHKMQGDYAAFFRHLATGGTNNVAAEDATMPVADFGAELASAYSLDEKSRAKIFKLLKLAQGDAIDFPSAAVALHLAQRNVHHGDPIPKRLPNNLWPRMYSALSASQPNDADPDDAQPTTQSQTQSTPTPDGATATPQIVDFDVSALEASQQQQPSPGSSAEEEESSVIPKNARFVINEIVDTEAGYVNDLIYIVNEYVVPLRAAKFIDTSKVNEIFATIEPMVSTNSMLRDELADARANLPPEQLVEAIANALIRVAPFFKMYGDYCNNQVNALDQIERLKSSKKAMAAFCQARAEAAGGLSAGDYLIKPIQRICKYPLLLKALLKELDSTAPGRPALERAYARICEIADVINEKKRDNEEKLDVYRVARNMSSAPKGLVHVTRRFRGEGPFTLNGEKERFYFLFNDLLIISKPYKGEKYKYKQSLLLQDIVINDDAPELPTFQLADIRHGANFVITLPDVPTKKAFVALLKKTIAHFKAHVESLEQRRKSTNMSASASDPDVARALAAASAASSTLSASSPGLDLEFENTQMVSDSVRTGSSQHRARSGTVSQGPTLTDASTAAASLGQITQAPKVEDHFCVLVLGREKSGKTALLSRAAGGSFESRYTPTLDPRKQKTVRVDVDGLRKSILLYEANINTLPTLTALSPAIHGLFLVFSVTDAASFAAIDDIMHHLTQTGAPTRGLPIVLVATHADKGTRRVVSGEDAVAMGDRYGAVFLEASSLTGNNVSFVFQLLTRQLIRKAGVSSASSASASVITPSIAPSSRQPSLSASSPALYVGSANPLLGGGGSNPLLGGGGGGRRPSGPPSEPPPPSYTPTASSHHGAAGIRPRSGSSIGHVPPPSTPPASSAVRIHDFNVNPDLLTREQLIDLVRRLQSNILACPTPHTPAK